MEKSTMEHGFDVNAFDLRQIERGIQRGRTERARSFSSMLYWFVAIVFSKPAKGKTTDLASVAGCGQPQAAC